MSNQLIVYKGNRTNVVSVNLGQDVSGATITSQIRAKPDFESTLIANWVISYPPGGDGSDGELIFTLDNTFSSQITANSGYMDIQMIVAGEPYPVFDHLIEVVFEGTVTT